MGQRPSAAKWRALSPKALVAAAPRHPRGHHALHKWLARFCPRCDSRRYKMAAVGGWLFLGEVVSLRLSVAAFLVLGGIGLFILSKKGKPEG